MKNTERQTVVMSAEELQAFEKFKKEEAAKEAAEQKKQQRQAYKELVDSTITSLFPELEEASRMLATKKSKVYDDFKAVLELKAEVYGESDQMTHTFTDSTGSMRIVIGNYTNDDYRDTVNEGIKKVKDVVSSLAKDDNSRALVNTILKLMSKDQKGNLKPSKVMQLRQLADEINNDDLKEGVKIIEESYQPTKSKTFVRCQKKAENNEWKDVPLGITEA